MKRPVFIIIGIVLVVILFSIWVYILIGGDVTPEDKYSDLDFNNTTDAVVERPWEGSTNTEDSIVNVGKLSKLKQLTTSPVAGFQEIKSTPSSTPEVYYTEVGTGHIYSIDLETGQVIRVSGTTVPATQKAVITNDGRFTFIKSGFGGSGEYAVAEIFAQEENILKTNILEDVIDFTTTNNNTFLYAVRKNNSVVGKEYSPISKATKELFTVPFSEAKIVWGKTANATHYVYPKPNSALEGYLYEIVSGKIKRLPVDGLGLTAVGSEDYILSGSQVKNSYETSIYVKRQNISVEFFETILPDKCTLLNLDARFICAIPNTPIKSDAPDGWYQGMTTYSDNLWSIDPDAGSLTLLLKIEEESGRELDIMNLLSNNGDNNLYFQNKNDQTLWTYELKDLTIEQDELISEEETDQ